MQHRVVTARAGRDFVVELRFAGGEVARVDLSEFVATGLVTESLRRDPDLFVDGLEVRGDGAWIGWPGEVEIDADALWYQAGPEELVHDFGPEVA